MTRAMRNDSIARRGSPNQFAFEQLELRVERFNMVHSVSSSAPVNYDQLMQANLTRVFGERDAQRRDEAIRELYAEDAVLNEAHARAAGHAEICNAVRQLLKSCPPDFVFHAIGPAVGHHGVGRLQWRSGLPNGPAVVTGTDVAHFENGLIQSLYVFLDPNGA